MREKIDAQKLGMAIRSVRRQRRMSQADFAKTIGVQRNTVARWEAGRFVGRLDSIATVIKLATTGQARRRLQSALLLPASRTRPITALASGSVVPTPCETATSPKVGVLELEVPDAKLSEALERSDA
jgi:DNA-binding XRE family transcriptional regulator